MRLNEASLSFSQLWTKKESGWIHLQLSISIQQYNIYEMYVDSVLMSQKDLRLMNLYEY